MLFVAVDKNLHKRHMAAGGKVFYHDHHPSHPDLSLIILPLSFTATSPVGKAEFRRQTEGGGASGFGKFGWEQVPCNW
ncbi:hypothetical protein M407DRAFT_181605 [Tulasnella calospora MUT 4182]|uniref:Uncharacterized protein n=1 Tax=Tulasnella calospora MUT 4182 TaxID=1051891 RepID=A0A0C3L3Q9_9AGAM|nr:hypothetical protein M407DRAFT_181605 [Tulasnella calospora MUT 4182]